jgi:PGM1 C-terminal domain
MIGQNLICSRWTIADDLELGEHSGGCRPVAGSLGRRGRQPVSERREHDSVSRGARAAPPGVRRPPGAGRGRTLQLLTDGRYDPTTALFLTPRGHEKHLIATDHFGSDLLRGPSASDLFDIVARHGLQVDQSRQVGIVVHMISSITEHGRVGITAVGDTPADADKRYREAQRILLEEARASLQEVPLPV